MQIACSHIPPTKINASDLLVVDIPPRHDLSPTSFVAKVNDLAVALQATAALRGYM